jgi:uncharacterized protein
MPIHEQVVEIAVADRRIGGTIVSPSRLAPGVLFVHGWAGCQTQYLARARELGNVSPSICTGTPRPSHSRGR